MISSTRNSRLLFSLLCLVLSLNLIKPFADYYFAISNQLITSLQVSFFVLISIAICNNLKLKNYELIFLCFIICKFIMELLYVSGDVIQAGTSLVKFLLLYLGSRWACYLDLNEDVYKKIIKLLLVFFIVSIIISAIQAISSQLGLISSTYGGNVISGNALGFFRSNGGIGGTVIDYTGLIYMYILLFFLTPSSYKYNLIKISLIIIATFQSFSRVLIVISSIFITYMLIIRLLRYSYKWIEKLMSFLALILIISLSWLYFSDISLLWETVSHKSDADRLSSWSVIYTSPSLMNILFGASMGANTGLPGSSIDKLIGDGQLQAICYDFGILGLVLYVGFFIDYLRNTIKKQDFLFILLTFIFFNIVNSAFDKYFNILMLPFFLLIIKQASNSKYQCVSINTHRKLRKSFFVRK